jgi:hypothetical protein
MSSLTLSPHCQSSQSTSSTSRLSPCAASACCSRSTATMVAARISVSSSDPQGISCLLSTIAASLGEQAALPCVAISVGHGNLQTSSTVQCHGKNMGAAGRLDGRTRPRYRPQGFVLACKSAPAHPCTPLWRGYLSTEWCSLS